MIFLERAKMPGTLEDHMVARAGGSRNSSDLLEAIRVLARRPTHLTGGGGEHLDVGEVLGEEDDEPPIEEDYADDDSCDGECFPM
eukprot:15437301-Alexandrium_andersonii.AAC.1